MNINLAPDEKFSKEIWWVLQQLKYLEITSRKGEFLRFVIKGFSIYPTPEAQQKALFKLEEWKAITILDASERSQSKSMVILERYYDFDFKIIHPKFDEVYEKYKKLNEPDNKADTLEILKFKHKLPGGTLWSFFTFIFTDSQNIKVNVGKFTETLNYKDFGLNSKKNDRPTMPWIFFYILAQNNGELKPNSKDKNDSYKKAKQTLSTTLQEFFSISYDPFYPYHTSTEKQGNSYKTQFNISCENLSTPKEMEEEEKSFFEQCTDSM